MNYDDAPIICYGEDGPAFTRLCPRCSRLLKFPKRLEWRESVDGICKFKLIKCSKCGPIEPYHIGWTGDFK